MSTISYEQLVEFHPICSLCARGDEDELIRFWGEGHGETSSGQKRHQCCGNFWRTWVQSLLPFPLRHANWRFAVKRPSS